uniref:lateral signaling target protein 2 homolog isoform X5 n=1 Tax=Halichoerus grypus TaxID=9711 RepID=UPI001659044E|nr:lateral signaling target protein 2 homolog isoform X5 [Halichoerus grypus]
MDVCIPQDRAPRDFCVKFPEEIRHDNLAGQLWFGAECLAAGSIIMNRELESMAMRPLAKELTRSLEDVRGALRDQALRDLSTYTEKMREALRHFDVLFAEFELSYVSAMVPVKSPREYYVQQEVIVLFCETVERALDFGYLTQDMIDDYEPALMFTIPRLAIVCGSTDQAGLEAAPSATREKIRSRFHGSHDLIHRLFVCISGVADQLQTNYASDLRSILKTLFEVMATKPETDDKEKLKKVTQSLRSAALEDCALCQETLSSSELAAKTRDGDLEDPPEWVPDEACGFCTACKAPFTVIRRKHHCRSCGKIFCSRCSAHSAPLPRYGQVKPVRVCTHCYVFHVTPFYSDKAGI